ncbi:MAG: preprotein translocase subunit SecE [Candidatus Pacebacteria bacterium]|nr:preprotein translocase subunit SecE [Candidatus Paceibacterota bacterium]
MVLKIKTFLKESFSELKRVNWPTKKETTRLTVVVIVLSLALALMLGVFDYSFSYLLELLIIK